MCSFLGTLIALGISLENQIDIFYGIICGFEMTIITHKIIPHLRYQKIQLSGNDPFSNVKIYDYCTITFIYI